MVLQFGVEELNNEFDEKQRMLLENGFRLAKCLNRTLILPKMFLNRFSPPRPAWFVHEEFLNELVHKYNIEVRESTFLSHPKVPKKFQNSVSPPVKIAMAKLSNKELQMVKEHKLFHYRPRSQVLGPTRLELQGWCYTLDKYAVLRFDSIWTEMKLLDDNNKQ